MKASKIDDLDRVGGHFNNILDSCAKSKEKYYKQGSTEQIAQLNERKIASLKGDELVEFQVFQQLWAASNSGQGKKIEEGSQIACNELIDEEGLKKLRSKGLAIPGEKKSYEDLPLFSGERAAAKEKLDEKRLERGLHALRSLCNAYEGIVRCFSSVSSPYGERVITEETAISNERAIKEQDEDYLWDFYQSLGGRDSVLK